MVKLYLTSTPWGYILFEYMLVIRLNRTGKRNKSQFRIALQEHTIAPGGKHVEILGSWDPHQKKGVFKAEKIKEWIRKGAQPSNTVQNLLINQGIIEGKKRAIKVHPVAGPQNAELNGVKLKPQEEVKAEAASGEKPAVVAEAKQDVKADAVKTDEAPKEEKKETTPEEKKEEAKKTEEAKKAEAKVSEKAPVEEKKEEVKTEEIKPEEKKDETKSEEPKK